MSRQINLCSNQDTSIALELSPMTLTLYDKTSVVRVSLDLTYPSSVTALPLAGLPTDVVDMLTMALFRIHESRVAADQVFRGHLNMLILHVLTVSAQKVGGVFQYYTIFKQKNITLPIQLILVSKHWFILQLNTQLFIL